MRIRPLCVIVQLDYTIWGKMEVLWEDYIQQ